MPASKTPPVHFHFPRPFTLSQRRELKLFIAKIFRNEGVPFGEVSYVFCSDKYLLEMNQRFLEHNFFTDIITFNLAEKKQPVVGEIYISVDRVVENAQELGIPFKYEILRVMFHGILHLCGYKDKSKKDVQLMRSKEDEYLRKYLNS